MSSYIFPGYPSFVESAAARLGLAGAAPAAGRIAPLAALANLCAQASHGDPAHAPGILAKAAEFRDQLAVALEAAELMLADVEAARPRPAAEGRAEVGISAAADPAPDPRRARRGPTTSRESS